MDYLSVGPVEVECFLTPSSDIKFRSCSVGGERGKRGRIAGVVERCSVCHSDNQNSTRIESNKSVCHTRGLQSFILSRANQCHHTFCTLSHTDHLRHRGDVTGPDGGFPSVILGFETVLR